MFRHRTRRRPRFRQPHLRAPVEDHAERSAAGDRLRDQDDGLAKIRIAKFGLRNQQHPVGKRVFSRTRKTRTPNAEQRKPDNQAAQHASRDKGSYDPQASGSVLGADAAAGAPIESSFTPRRTAVISATMDTAISAGVLLPMRRPTGPCSRAISAADKSKSR